jgi:hypothetical protein
MAAIESAEYVVRVFCGPIASALENVAFRRPGLDFICRHTKLSDCDEDALA